MAENEIKAFCERRDAIPANFTFSPGGFTKEDAENAFRTLFLK